MANGSPGYKPYKIEGSDLIVPGWAIQHRGEDVDKAVSLARKFLKDEPVKISSSENSDDKCQVLLTGGNTQPGANAYDPYYGKISYAHLATDVLDEVVIDCNDLSIFEPK